jgi:hypothetical protein
MVVISKGKAENIRFGVILRQEKLKLSPDIRKYRTNWEKRSAVACQYRKYDMWLLATGCV